MDDNKVPVMITDYELPKSCSAIDPVQLSVSVHASMLELLQHMASAKSDFCSSRSYKYKIEPLHEFCHWLCQSGTVTEETRRSVEAKVVQYARDMLQYSLRLASTSSADVSSDPQLELAERQLLSMLTLTACLPYNMSCPYAAALRAVALKAPAKRVDRQRVQDLLNVVLAESKLKPVETETDHVMQQNSADMSVLMKREPSEEFVPEPKRRKSRGGR